MRLLRRDIKSCLWARVASCEQSNLRTFAEARPRKQKSCNRSSLNWAVAKIAPAFRERFSRTKLLAGRTRGWFRTAWTSITWCKWRHSITIWVALSCGLFQAQKQWAKFKSGNLSVEGNLHRIRFWFGRLSPRSRVKCRVGGRDWHRSRRAQRWWWFRAFYRRRK